ncbi:hypothetical protein EUTSA_v10012324mg, partial [Eutrema salsugineum]
ERKIQENSSIQIVREIPIDLLMDIFSRVPATTIARLWRSILIRPDFTELFLTMSRARPRLLLFTFQVKDKIFFFSSPLPQNPDDNSCLILTRYHVHHKHSPGDFSLYFGSPLGGFICRIDKRTLFICNPVTGESISLPKIESKSLHVFTQPFLGYDPINKQFKVLCISITDASDGHQILTLENGNPLWRDIKCMEPHYPKSSGICIDGVLYYTAGVDPQFRVTMIIDKNSLMTSSCTLIDYKGKLGALQLTFLSPNKRLEFWLLEDAAKCSWSKNIYTFPSFTQKIVDHNGLAILGMTDNGEVVLSPYAPSVRSYIYYYNLKSNSFTRVQIHGLELFKGRRVYPSIDYVENLKLM